jgi:UDP-3-O-[3-hydroxymyristoyl] glucosamine N-acyltransferase
MNASGKTISAGELAKILGSEVIGNKDVIIDGVNTLSEAKATDVSFLGNLKYKSQLETTKASVIIVSKELGTNVPEGKAWILSDSPNIAFSRAINFFAPPTPAYLPGIHSTAVVSKSAKIPENCHIGPCVVIEDGVELGENTKVLAGTFIGEYTKIGKECLLYQNIVIRERSEIGNRVIIHPNVCIGADGYGYEPGPLGIVKIPQVGIVKIDDDVEIGANSTIDRARFGKTWIKTGVKIDNLVHVAHNVTVGEFSMLIGQCGIAGSAKIGQGVIIAGQAGVTHHVTVGDGAKIAGTAGITKDVPPGGVYAGTPAEPVREFMERMTLPKSVKKLKERIKVLEELCKGFGKE